MAHEKNAHFVLVSSPLMHEMGEAIAKRLEGKGLHMPHYRLTFTQFANGEYVTQIPAPVRGQHVFFLTALQHPDPNTVFMQTLIAMDAMKRASVNGITLVAPYLSYLRQDRKDKARVPISARLIADLLESNQEFKQLITIDMHAEQEQGFFSVPVDNLTGVRLFSEHIRSRFGNDLRNVVAVAADFGAAVRTRRLSAALGDIPVSIFEKRRPGPNQSEIVSIIGASVKDSHAIIYEDIVDSGGTIRKVAKALKDKGASDVHVYATHGIFTGDSLERFSEDELDVSCSDSIPRSAEFYAVHKWLTRVPIDAYFAEAIYEATIMGGSISKLAS